MKRYQRFLTSGLMTAVGLGIIGCNQDSNQNKPVKPKSIEPIYINGSLKSEKFQDNIVDSDIYYFTLSTENGLRLFRCWGDYEAPKMDLLLNPGDKAKFKIRDNERDKKNDYKVSLDNLVEINGEPFSR